MGASRDTLSLAIEAVDVVGFERSVRGKVESVFCRDEGDGASLLVALKHGLDAAEIAGGAQDAAFIAVVAGEDPETVSPGIVDDVVNVADGALGKGVGDGPGRSGVGGGVDVNFVALRVVEVLSPENCAGGNGGDVERTRAAEDSVRLAKFSFSWAECDDRARNGGYESAIGQHGECMKTIAEQSRGEAVEHGETAAQSGTEGGDGLPTQVVGGILNSCAKQLVSAGSVESVAVPCERSQIWKAGDANRASFWRGGHSGRSGMSFFMVTLDADILLEWRRTGNEGEVNVEGNSRFLAR